MTFYFCKRHIDLTSDESCTYCDTEKMNRSKNQRRRILAAWKAINAWVNVETMPKGHPLQQMRRALGK
jgi:hypothetical protein